MALGPNSIRHLLYGINFLFVFTGIILIAHGMENVMFYRHYGDLIQEQYIYISYFQIVIGIGIFFVAILGWYGALAESSFVTLMFSTCLLLIFFLELTAGIGGYFLNMTTRHSLTVSLRLPNGTDDYEMMYRWDRLQNDFSCCGIERSKDWLNQNNEDKHFVLPDSCCNDSNECVQENVRRMGCFVPLENAMQNNCLSIIILGGTAAAFQLVGIVMTCFLSGEFRKGYETV